MGARQTEADTYKWYLERNGLDSYLCLSCCRLVETTRPREGDTAAADKPRCCKSPHWSKVISPTWDGDVLEDRWITVVVKRCAACKRLGPGSGHCKHCPAGQMALHRGSWQSGTKSFRLGNSIYSRIMRRLDRQFGYTLWLQWPKGRVLSATH